MSQKRDRRTGRRMFGPILMLVAVLVLSACGLGGGEDDPDPTATDASIPESTQLEQETVTDTASPGVRSTPVSAGITPAEGTPEDAGASPTPRIVVSAPPVSIPTSPPTTAASPASSPPAGADTGEATDEVVSADVTVGDGTGGVGAGLVVSPEADTVSAESSPVASPMADITIVATCDVSEYPSFAGEDSQRVTSIDVNFRAGPGPDCDVIGETVSAGVVVEVLSEPVRREGAEGFEWVAVSIDGVEGWLATEFLEPVEAEQ